MSNGDGLCVLYAARRSRPTGSWGFLSPIPSWPWEKHNHIFRRTIALSLKGGEELRFCRSPPFGFSKMAILYQVDALA